MRVQTNTVTLSDIAEKLQISVGAVSRTLNNYPGVGKDLAEKIRTTAQEMGYQYHPFKSRRSDTIGLVLAVPGSVEILPSYMSKLVICMERITQREGKYLLVHLIQPDLYEEQLKNIISNRRTDGILINGAMPRDFYTHLKRDLPTVVINDVISRTGCNTVINNPYEAIEKLLERLTKLGHRDIAYIQGDRKYSVINRRFDAWVTALRKFDLNLDPKLVLDGLDQTPRGIRNCMDKCLKMKKIPTAMVFPNDTMAFNACAELRVQGLQVPKDMSLISCSNDPMGEQMIPPLTSIDVKLQEVTQIAFKLLTNLMASPNDEIIQKEVNTSLIWRESCGKPAECSNG